MSSVKESAHKTPEQPRATEAPDSNSGAATLSADELRQQNSALEKDNQELRRVAQYRSIFLARLAHELRTPLTSILGFSEILLSQEELTDAQRNFCERIQNSAQQLQGNLNQLSDLSRLEAGQSDIVCEEFHLDDVLRQSCAAVARQAQKKKVELRCEPSCDLPLVISDRGKLGPVLYNFLAYAIGRSPEGGTVTAAAEAGGSGCVIKIADEGESLPDPTVIGALDLSDRRSGNSELGLAIANHNMHLLGANLIVRGRKPQGLEVEIQLPSKPAPGPG
jgi:signal transduction histidine kinase